MARRRRSHCIPKVCALIVPLFLFSMLLTAPRVHGQDDAEAATKPKRIDLNGLRELLNTGQYDECIKAAGEQAGKIYGEGYFIVKVQAELARGKYSDATKTVEAGIKKYAWSIGLRWLGHKAFLHAGNNARASEMIKDIDRLFETQQWRYSDAEDLVTLGRVALLIGADPRVILENFFDRAKKNAKGKPEGYIAAGEMALDKNDKQLAAELFTDAAKRFPENVEVLFGLARSLTETNASRSGELFEQILKLNERHVPTILLQADRLISSEQFGPAENNIKLALKVNPNSPKAWAFRAAIAHLQSDTEREIECRNTALATWKDNPNVDFWVGEKLSRAYRFTEGAKYQRRALAFDPSYLPARIQLSQDLLRLGQVEEGWKLAEAAHEADGYDTTTFNLLNLRDHMLKFRTIENDHFILRMSESEAGIYGDRVIRLLERARTTLTAKYGLDLQDKITVEIFPVENDFAVRTFGMPAVSGFLGVCFGKVITANSPASQLDNPNNWEAVLWHEFCHVVTLSMTNNKMPRWLSEGISVFEESNENPAWGMEMQPQYRQWILEGQMQKVSELSKAFINAPSPQHVQFAYFQSSLVVQYIAQEHGIQAIKEILGDLGNGVLINEALNRRTSGIEDLEEGFVKFAEARANALAPKVDWEPPAEVDILRDPDQLAEFLTDNPNNYIALQAKVQGLIRAELWDEAETVAKYLLEIYPEDRSGSNAQLLLTVIYRGQGKAELERRALEDYVAIADDAVSSYERLIEIYSGQKNYVGVMAATERLFAVNPLMKAPWKLRAEAAEATNQPEQAIEAWRSTIVLGPEDPAFVHYRLAKLLFEKGDPAAKRHVLQALEEAPRYRDAHKLLLQIISGVGPAADKPGVPDLPATPPSEDAEPEKGSQTEDKNGR